MDGRTQPSPYWDGIFTYWIGSLNGTPYCFLLTSYLEEDRELPDLWRKHLSKSGKSLTVDFCIGNEDFLGKGWAAPTLKSFTEFY